jgi:hypothetical protein
VNFFLCIILDVAGSHDRSKYFFTNSNATNADHYLGSFYWTVATITAAGSVGDVKPQNEAEVLWTTVLLLLNMTLFRWVVGEASSIIMIADEQVVQARQQLEQVTSFLRNKRFSPALKY